MRIIHLYTDGACSGNPGPGGWAYIFFDVDNPKEIIQNSDGEDYTTNQRMELTACVAGLYRISYDEKAYHLNKIKIHTDSAYIVNCFKEGWYKKWEKNGWKTSKGSPVKNGDLWTHLLILIDVLPAEVEFIKVKGHSGNVLNEKVDKLAKYEIEKINYQNTHTKIREKNSNVTHEEADGLLCEFVHVTPEKAGSSLRNILKKMQED